MRNGSITIGERTIVYNPLTTIYLYQSKFFEEHTIESTAWTELDNSAYSYSTTITLTTDIYDDSVVELVNDQADLFATYGFAIGSISGQVATIYSIGQPSESVTLTLEVTA